MLRLIVILLLLANGGYYAWSQGHLRAWGYAPLEQAEPQRMDQQIRPETLQILRVNSSAPGVPGTPGAESKGTQGASPSQAGGASAPSSSNAPAAPVEAPAPAPAVVAASAPAPKEPPGVCLQAGVFDDRQAEAVRTAAAGLPAGSWALQSAPIPGRWMVFMGRFDDVEALDKKRSELRARNVSFDRAGGTWELGLSLGRFSTEEAAKRELGHLANRGIRTARVVQERPDSTGHLLRLAHVTDAVRPQWEAVLRTALAGRTLRACAD